MNYLDGPFVRKIDPNLADKLRQDLSEMGFDLSQPEYTLLTAKKKGISCTLYATGKLVVQGKEMGELIEYYLEPEILKDFSYTHPKEIDRTFQIGVDESGKGDFFGPLCIAGVYAGGDRLDELLKMGVKDSKLINDAKAIALGIEIQKRFESHVVKITPLKYNVLYSQFGNLNHLLAWGHATVIEQLVLKTQCKNVVVDQFAAESVVEKALKKKGVEVILRQQPRAEEVIVVAAASIVARMSFLLGLEQLSKEFGIFFPKGASEKVKETGRAFIQKYGKEDLGKVAKLHFKTSDLLYT